MKLFMEKISKISIDIGVMKILFINGSLLNKKHNFEVPPLLPFLPFG